VIVKDIYVNELLNTTSLFFREKTQRGVGAGAASAYKQKLKIGQYKAGGRNWKVKARTIDVGGEASVL